MSSVDSTFPGQMCAIFVDEHKENWEANAAGIIKGILSFGRDATIETKLIEGDVYVVHIGAGTATASMPGSAYFGPGATKIKVGLPHYTGLLSGKYTVTLITTDDRGCISTIKFLGAELKKGEGEYDLDLSNPYLEIKAGKGEDCGTPIGISIYAEPSYEGGKPFSLELQLLPLKVKFDRLVQALTCPDFHLDDLKEDVKRSVLAAALGSDDPCSQRNNIGGGKGGSETVGNYYWTVTDNTFYAKSSPDATEYDFYIKFEGKEPMVWVEDVPEEGEECEVAKDALQEATKYQNYDLKIVLNNNFATSCLDDYGSAKGGELLRAVQSNAPYAAYLTGCTSGAILCNTAMALASGGTSLLASLLSGAGDVASCGIGYVVGKLLTPMLVERTIAEDHSRLTQSAFPLLTMIGGGAIAYKSTGMMQTNLFLLRNQRLPKILERTAAEIAETTSTGAVEVVGETAEDKATTAIKAVLGLDESTGDIADALKNPSKRSAAADRLKELAKILRGADDELADQLDDAARALLEGGDKGISRAVRILENALGNADALKNLANQLEKAMKTAKQTRTQALTQAFICGAISQSMGAIAGSLTAMTQVARTDILAVQITPKNVVSIGLAYDPDLHKMIVAG